MKSFAHSDVALSSGAYSYGHTSAAKDLSGMSPVEFLNSQNALISVLAGDYTVILSTFEPKDTGSYSLNVSCSSRVEVLSQIPNEGAGMYSKPIRGSWTSDNAAGAPQFKRYKDNPIYQLKLPSQSELLYV